MFAWIGHTGRDLRQALRQLRRHAGVSAVVVLSLAVGIGANTTVFSWFQALVVDPIPGAVQGGRFVMVEPRNEDGSFLGVSWLEYRDLATRVRTIPDLIAFRSQPFNIGAADWSERAYGQLVSANYFSALGVRPAFGRLIEASDVDRAAAPVAVVSYGFWQARLAGSREAIGQTIRINDRLVTVVGVTPDGFQGTVLGLYFEVWAPATLAPVLTEGTRDLDSRGARGFSALGRPAAGVTREAVQQEVDRAMQALAQEHPDTNRGVRADVLAFWQAPRGPQQFLLGAVLALQAVMLLVLLVVCGNTANLILATASARQYEIGVRISLGASRARVVALLLTESVLLALVGGALGALLAVWGTGALRNVPMPGIVPIRFQTHIDATTVWFAVGLALLSGVAFGLAPAMHMARRSATAMLRDGSVGIGRGRLRDVLVVIEVAVALIVLVVSTMFLKGFRDAQSVDPGFARDGMLLAAYDLRGRTKAIDAAASLDFVRRVTDRLSSLPSVEAAAIATSVPLDIHGLGERSFVLDGRARADGKFDEAATNTVTPGYFAAMHIPFRAGSNFTALGDATAPPQAIVNQAFVDAYVGAVDPLGRTLTNGSTKYLIIGVVRTTVSNAFGEPPTPAMYFSYRDRPSATGEIHVRVRGGSESSVVPDLRRVVRDVDPTLPLYNVRSLNEHVDQNLVFRKIPARMFLVLGPLILVLAATGVYAVVAHAVTLRTKEMAIRLALGSSPSRLVGLLTSETMKVVGAGALAGWLIAYVIDHDVVAGTQVGAIDPWMLTAVPMVLLSVAAAACVIPARRATRVDPNRVLRD